MKNTVSTARILAGLGFAASLFWGCLDPMSQSKDNTTPTDNSALSLSIKDNGACRDQWSAILAARSAGHQDSATEAAFLANCVTEVKAGKDKNPPYIPPNLVPDSLSRCHWIVSQIDGGRNEMTVSYKRYCPDDCRKLEIHDSTRHEKLCRDPDDTGKVDTAKGNPHDTSKVDPRDTSKANEDTCKLIRARLATMASGSADYIRWSKILMERCGHPPVDTDSVDCRAIYQKLSVVKPGEPGRADLERAFKEGCHDTLPKPPHDTLVIPPKDTLPKPPIVNCDSLRKRLAGLDTNSADYLHLKGSFREHCPEKPPVVIPPKDTLPKPPIVNCDSLRKRLAGLDTNSADYLRLKGSFREHCPEKPPVVIPPKDTVVVPPKDTLPKPVIPRVNCDELRAKLAALDPTSADYAHIKASLALSCTEPKPVVK